MKEIATFKDGNLEFGQGENGMYWSQLTDEFGQVIRGRVGYTLQEVLEGIREV